VVTGAIVLGSGKSPPPAQTAPSNGTSATEPPTRQKPAETKATAGRPATAPGQATAKDDEEYDPRDTVARVRLIQAKAFAEKCPEDKWEYGRQLQDITDGYPGTKTAGEAKQLLAGLGLAGPPPTNIAGRGSASSPDGWEKDGSASGDAAAIDGNPDTFWDEEDGKPLYRLRIDFSSTVKIVGIRILGFEHHNFAPKDFDVCCDDAVVKEVRGATYENNRLRLMLPVSQGRSVELKITGYYGGSPAIRELEIIGWLSANP
jgi:hypothetical protein